MVDPTIRKLTFIWGWQKAFIQRLILIVSALKHINQVGLFLNGCRISSYFDTKFTAIVLIELTLHKFEDLNIQKLLNLEEVYFLGASRDTRLNIRSSMVLHGM